MLHTKHWSRYICDISIYLYVAFVLTYPQVTLCKFHFRAPTWANMASKQYQQEQSLSTSTLCINHSKSTACYLDVLQTAVFTFDVIVIHSPYISTFSIGFIRISFERVRGMLCILFTSIATLKPIKIFWCLSIPEHFFTRQHLRERRGQYWTDWGKTGSSNIVYKYNLNIFKPMTFSRIHVLIGMLFSIQQCLMSINDLFFISVYQLHKSASWGC